MWLDHWNEMFHILFWRVTWNSSVGSLLLNGAVLPSGNTGQEQKQGTDHTT